MSELCFVLMPFGTKDVAGKKIQFDAVYQQAVKPAILDAGLEPIRADEEQLGGLILKPMFERLVLCRYAVADLTGANANVAYELGVRHGIRPYSTVLLFAEGGRLPFDLQDLRCIPYPLTEEGTPTTAEATRRQIADSLRAAQAAATDSPVFQLVEGLGPPDLAHVKTDVFRSRVNYSKEMKDRLAMVRARKADTSEERRKIVEDLRKIETELGDVSIAESAVVVDVFLSYRAREEWKDMIRLKERMSRPLQESVMVQEQFALALNRDKQGDQAERVLFRLIEQRGPSSETYGILGRVYKDNWKAAIKAGEQLLARGLLEKAIDTYLKGFQADWRDAYPGINALTLMELREPPDPRRAEILPVVIYSVKRRLASGKPDYWDHATLLELAVLGKDETSAAEALSASLASIREIFEPKSTAGNLRLIREARERRGEPVPWALEIENALLRRS